MKKSPIALCLSGQPRFYKGPGLATIQRLILDRYSPDVFFHAWWSEADIGRCYAAAPWSGVAGSADLTVRAETLRELLELYRPLRWKCEPIRPFPLPRDYSSRTSDPAYAPPNLFSACYSIRECARLKSDAEGAARERYQWVIRIRFDSIFENFVALESLAADRIYIPDVCPNPVLMYDCVSISNSADYDAMAALFENLDLLFMQGVQMNAEQMFLGNLAHRGIESRAIKLPIRCDHCRTW